MPYWSEMSSLAKLSCRRGWEIQISFLGGSVSNEKLGLCFKKKGGKVVAIPTMSHVHKSYFSEPFKLTYPVLCIKYF